MTFEYYDCKQYGRCDYVECGECGYRSYVYCECENLYCTKHFVKDCDKCLYKYRGKYMFINKKSALKQYIDNRFDKRFNSYKRELNAN